MLLLGCKPDGRHTEQHDVYFAIGQTMADLIPGIKNFWKEAKGDIHVDAWREVTYVKGFDIKIISNNEKELNLEENTNHLFFINLGGYKKDEFEEYHYKMIAIAKEKGEAIRQSMQTIFYKHTGFKGASSHVDDKYGIDVDDAYAIKDILPADIKEKYSIYISRSMKEDADELHLGYFTLEKLQLM